MQRECPYCAEKIQKRAKLCRFCSAKVDPIYVDNAAANKQICKIMSWHEEGIDIEDIAKNMNDSGDLTLDSKEQWTPDRIKTIVTSFTKKNTPQPESVSNNPRSSFSSGDFRTEQVKCFCTKCNLPQNEIVSFQEGRCNHILHAILTVLTWIWGVGWLIIYINSQNETKNNRRLAIAEKRCSQCGSSLIPMN